MPLGRAVPSGQGYPEEMSWCQRRASLLLCTARAGDDSAGQCQRLSHYVLIYRLRSLLISSSRRIKVSLHSMASSRSLTQVYARVGKRQLESSDYIPEIEGQHRVVAGLASIVSRLIRRKRVSVGWGLKVGVKMPLSHPHTPEV